MQNKIKEHSLEVQELMEKTIESHYSTLLAISESIISCLKSGGKIIIIGNGGSYTDSFHFAAELEGAYRNRNRQALAALVPSNPASLTAIGNDFGYDMTFKKFSQAFAKEDDIIIGLSTNKKITNFKITFIL